MNIKCFFHNVGASRKVLILYAFFANVIMLVVVGLLFYRALSLREKKIDSKVKENIHFLFENYESFNIKSSFDILGRKIWNMNNISQISIYDSNCELKYKMPIFNKLECESNSRVTVGNRIVVYDLVSQLSIRSFFLKFIIEVVPIFFVFYVLLIFLFRNLIRFYYNNLISNNLADLIDGRLSDKSFLNEFNLIEAKIEKLLEIKSIHDANKINMASNKLFLKRFSQFAHDIRSPLEIITYLLKNEQVIHKKEIDMCIQRIEEITNTTLNDYTTRKDDLFSIQKILTSYQNIELWKIQLVVENKTDVSCIVSKPIFNNIVQNIIGNSIDAGATYIKVIVEFKDDLFRITFQDNGFGFSQEIISNLKNNIFKTTKKSGFGVGLQIIQDAADELGFYCNFSNNEEGAEIILIEKEVNACNIKAKGL